MTDAKKIQELKRRLEKLQEDLTELKRQRGIVGHAAKWWIDHAGRFQDDPSFEEMVRLGRQYRESLRPKAKKKRRRSTKSNRGTSSK